MIPLHSTFFTPAFHLEDCIHIYDIKSCKFYFGIGMDIAMLKDDEN